MCCHRLVFILALLAPSFAFADAPVTFGQAEEGSIRVDGSLREWRGVRWQTLGDTDGRRLRFALLESEAGFYVGASVNDERVIVSGATTDAVQVDVAAPQGNTFATTEVRLVPGSQALAARATAGGRAIRSAEVVEALTQNGYDIEAFVPWTAIRNAAERRASRVAVSYIDVDSEARGQAETIATARWDARSPQQIPEAIFASAGGATLSGFLQARGLQGTTPRYQFRAELTGAGDREQIAIVDRDVVVYGPEVAEGRGFRFFSLPIESAADVLHAEIREVTNDSTPELLVSIRQRGQATRELLLLVNLTGETLSVLSGLETRLALDNGAEQRATVRFSNSRRSTQIVRRIEALTWPDVASPAVDAPWPNRSPERDITALPAPSVEAQTFVWQEGRLQESQTVQRRGLRTTASAQRPAPTARATSEDRPTADALLARALEVLEVREAPRFTLDRNIGEDAERERIAVIDRSLLIVGPRFRGGNGYFRANIDVADARDLLAVETMDITGDGRDEIFVRIRKTEGDVTREIALVHQYKRNGSMARLFAFEVARAQGRRRLTAAYEMANGALRIRVERSQGFTRENWTWQDVARPNASGIVPIPTPWGTSERRIRVTGTGVTVE